MKLIIVACALSLVGCATTSIPKDQPVAIHYKYVITKIPPALLSVPDPLRYLNTKTATDKDAALWFSELYGRGLDMETKLKAIKQFQDDKLKNLKVPPEDIID